MTTQVTTQTAGGSRGAPPDTRSGSPDDEADPTTVELFNTEMEKGGKRAGDGAGPGPDDGGGSGSEGDGSRFPTKEEHYAYLVSQGMPPERAEYVATTTARLNEQRGFERESAGSAAVLAHLFAGGEGVVRTLDPPPELLKSLEPTDGELRSFRDDPAVKAAVGDNPLLEDDGATGALMTKLAAIREDPDSARDDDPVLQAFGLSAEEARDLAKSDSVGEYHARIEGTVMESARKADAYLEKHPSARLVWRTSVDEDGKEVRELVIVDPDAKTPERRRELAEANEGLVRVTDAARFDGSVRLATGALNSLATDSVEQSSNRRESESEAGPKGGSSRRGGDEQGRSERGSGGASGSPDGATGAVEGQGGESADEPVVTTAGAGGGAA